jgi:hypothetical protein
MLKQTVFLSLTLLVSLLSGCLPFAGDRTLDDDRMSTKEPTSAELTATVEADIAASTPPENCPVNTAADATPFTAPEPYSADAPWEGYFWFGTTGLWTALPTDGVWEGLPDNPQGYTQKIMWWSDQFVAEKEPQPALVVSGRRLDTEAPPLPFHGATNAMAGDIKTAMLTGVDFPTLGCWEIMGEYKDSTLTFVVWIAP